MSISVAHITTANTLSVTIPATTAGNCLVVCIGVQAVTPSVSGITLGGSAGNFAQLETDTSSSESTWIWADPNCAGGQTAIVISGTNLSVDATHGGVSIHEVAGLVSASPLDQKASGHGSTTTTWTSGAAGPTLQAAELWIGCAASIKTITGPASPWINTAFLGGMMAGYQIVSATGTATYSGTLAASGSYSASVVTLKGAGGGPAVNSGAFLGFFP